MDGPGGWQQSATRPGIEHPAAPFAGLGYRQIDVEGRDGDTKLTELPAVKPRA